MLKPFATKGVESTLTGGKWYVREYYEVVKEVLFQINKAVPYRQTRKMIMFKSSVPPLSNKETTTWKGSYISVLKTVKLMRDYFSYLCCFDDTCRQSNRTGGPVYYVQYMITVIVFLEDRR